MYTLQPIYKLSYPKPAKLQLHPIIGAMIKQIHEDFENDLDNNSELSYDQQKEDSYQGSSQKGVCETNEFFQMHGMFFCSTCKNLMEPARTKAEILEFKCRRCGLKAINFTKRPQQMSMVMCKSLQTSLRKNELEDRSIFDKSMPVMRIECPECSYQEGVYTVVPEEGERRIMIKLICGRGAEDSIVKCGHKWSLSQEKQIDDEEFGGALQVREEIEEKG